MDRLMRVAYEIPEAINVIAGFSASGRTVTRVRDTIYVNIIDSQPFENNDRVSNSSSVGVSSIKKGRKLEFDITNVVVAA